MPAELRENSSVAEPISPSMPLSATPGESIDHSSLPNSAVVDYNTEEETLSSWLVSVIPLYSKGTAAFLSTLAGFEITLLPIPVHTEESVVLEAVVDPGLESAQTVVAPPTPPAARPTPVPASPPAARRPTPAAASPPSVARSAPAPSSPTAETSPPAAPVERELRHHVDPVPSLTDTQMFTVRLSGSGWVFIDGPEGILFHSRSRGRDEEVFTFRSAQRWEEGQFSGGELIFKQQDLLAGINRTHREEINVDTLAVTMTEPSSESSNLAMRLGASGTGGLNSAGSVLSREEFTEQWPDLDPEQREFARRVLETAENHPPVEQVVLLVSALELVEYSDADLIFRLARLLEQPGVFRDIYRSHQLYQQVRDDFPFSPHRETSRQRIEFLERHFLLIR